MKKITMLLMSLLISVGAMAQVQIQVSTSTTNPQYVYYMKNGNGFYVGAQSKYTGSEALFAFFGTNGKYQIYDYTSKKWLTYTEKSGSWSITGGNRYKNGTNFVSVCDNQNDAKYFKVENYSGTNYQIQPYYSSGDVAPFYLNYYGGISDNVALGLYTTNGTGDPGSRWTFEKVELEKSIASLGDLSNDKVYMLKSYRSGGKAVYNSNYPNVAAWNGHSSSSSITEGNAVKWAIYKSSSNKYYVYSIGGGKFWGQTTTNNVPVPLVADITNDVEIKQRSSISGYSFMFSLNSDKSADEKGIVNASTHNDHTPGLINWKDGYNVTDDQGSAFAIIEAGNIDQSVKAFIEQKVEAFENPFTIDPAKYYRIKSRAMNLSTNPYATVGVQGAAYLSSSIDLTASVSFRCHTASNADAACIWAFEANGNAWKIKNVNTNKYISPNTNSDGYLQYTDANNAASFTWENSSTVEGVQYGYLKFQSGTTTYHLQALGEGARRAATKGAIGVEWVILLAEELDVTISSSAGYGTIYLPFDVTLPVGLKAYAATAANQSYVSLTEKEDIPANNGAILEGSGTYTLNIAAANSNWEDNKLLGTNVNTYVQGPAYVLGMKEDGVGLYMAELNKNETGGTGNTHFLNNANKAYLPASAVPQASQVQALFFNVDETTGVEEVEVESTAKTIYDLSGRKVSGMSAPGLYIVNGKKVLVK